MNGHGTAFFEVKLDGNGNILKINRIFSGLNFAAPIDAEMGPDGALYVLEWGVEDDRFSANNPDAKLVRIDFVGNLPPLLGDYNGDSTVGAADYTAWRNSSGQTGLASFAGADGNGDGRITGADYNIWKSHFGESLSMAAGGGGAIDAGLQSGPFVAGNAARRSTPEPQGFELARSGFELAQTQLAQGATTNASSRRLPAKAHRTPAEPLAERGLLAWLATRPGERRDDRPASQDSINDKDTSSADVDEVFGAFEKLRPCRVPTTSAQFHGG